MKALAAKGFTLMFLPRTRALKGNYITHGIHRLLLGLTT
jgi:hypothetical protein